MDSRVTASQCVVRRDERARKSGCRMRYVVEKGICVVPWASVDNRIKETVDRVMHPEYWMYDCRVISCEWFLKLLYVLRFNCCFIGFICSVNTRCYLLSPKAYLLQHCYYVTAVNLPWCYHVTVTVELYRTCNSNYPQSNSTRQGNFKGFPSFVCELLARSQYASDRSCDRPSRHTFSWVFKQRSGWLPPFQVATACFSCIIKINPHALK